MSLDDHLHQTFDTLAARLKDEIVAHAASTVDDLVARVQAERAEAVAHAAAEARAEAERDVAERVAAARADAERQAADRVDAVRADAERSIVEQVAAVRAAVEREMSEGIAAARAEAEHDVAERLAAARAEADRDGAERVAAALAEAERDAADRIAAACAAVERDADERLSVVRAEADREAAARLSAARAEHEHDLAGRLSVVRAEVEREMLGRIALARTEAERDIASRLTTARAEVEAQVRAECEHEQHAARDRVLGAIRSMDRADSLSDILDVLVSSASAEAARAGIFLSEGDRLRSWRCVGFSPRLNESGALNIPFIEAGIVAEAARTGFVANAGGSSPALAPFFAELPPGRRAVAVPLQMSGHVFGVLYADQGPAGDMGNGAWPATLEVLARHAARSLEAVTAYRLAQVEAGV